MSRATTRRMMGAPVTATYRLQLHAGFTLDAARSLVPYLQALGVSHVYTSPVLAAVPGSQHGYDLTDPTRLNPELGDDRSLDAFARALHERGMGWMLDIVPNHMAANRHNRYWDDVLRRGTRSPFARWFDIVWDAPQQWLRGRVMLPILDDDLENVLARDEITVALDENEMRVRYFDHSFPIDPATLWRIVEPRLERVHDARVAALLAELSRTSRATAEALRTGQAADHRARVGDEPEGEILARLSRLTTENAGAREHLESLLHRYASGDDGRGRMRTLLAGQAYALVWWRRAALQINYRRFFEISDLIGVRQEDPAVFTATHGLILDWIEHGLLDGLRIDHVDGLFDPAAYLRTLRTAANERGGTDAPIFVEKILSEDEVLRQDWPVDGTTGYDVLNDIESVLIEAEGAHAVEQVYRDALSLGDRAPRFTDVARRAKQYVLRHAFMSDIRRVARLMAPVLRRRDRRARAARRAIRDAVFQLAAALPVYRTYLDGTTATPEDRALLVRAQASAGAGGSADRALLARIVDVMVREDPADAGDTAQLRRRAIGLFQQITSPAMAKGVEDTALYMYAPLASLNEVGGTPQRDLHDAPRRLHDRAAARLSRWPRSLVCTETHDTKRSADVRARLDVLSELPDEWRAAVRAWSRLTRSARRKVGGRYEPDRNTEYLLYQALLGTWPVESRDEQSLLASSAARTELRARLEQYILKAAREAKMRTSWVEPRTEFEEALREYVGRLLGGNGTFLKSVGAFAGMIVRPGLWNALSRIVMHLTTPGTPDVYQGGELWSFSLVDPDNRRPVDYELRHRLVKELETMFDRASEDSRTSYVDELLGAAEDGRIKMHVTRQILRFRRADPELFSTGAYAPLECRGGTARHLVCFVRSKAGRTAISFASRLSRTLIGGTAPPIGDVWGDTRVSLNEALLHVRRWTCVVSGHSVEVPSGPAAGGLPIADVLKHLPVALLIPANQQPATAA